MSDKNSKKEIFSQWYDRYFPAVYSVCLRYSSGRDEAKDLAQDVFVKCYQRMDGFRGDATPLTWLYRIAINTGIDHLRKKKPHDLEPEKILLLPAPDEPGEAELLDRMTLKRILEEFSDRTREVLMLHYYENLSQVEVGELMGISRQAVKKHLERFQRSFPRFRHLMTQAFRTGAAAITFLVW